MKWFHRPGSHGTLALRRDRGRLKEFDVSFCIPNADHMPRMTAAFDMRGPDVPSTAFPTAHVNHLRRAASWFPVLRTGGGFNTSKLPAFENKFSALRSKATLSTTADLIITADLFWVGIA